MRNAGTHASKFQKKLANLIGEIGLESNRQDACKMLDDISAGGKKLWYSAMVELKTH